MDRMSPLAKALSGMGLVAIGAWVLVEVGPTLAVLIGLPCLTYGAALAWFASPHNQG